MINDAGLDALKKDRSEIQPEITADFASLMMFSGLQSPASPD